MFGLPDGQSTEAPFLHEKDLDKKRGGLEDSMRPSPRRSWKRYWRRSGEMTTDRTVTQKRRRRHQGRIRESGNT